MILLTSLTTYDAVLRHLTLYHQSTRRDGQIGTLQVEQDQSIQFDKIFKRYL